MTTAMPTATTISQPHCWQAAAPETVSAEPPRRASRLGDSARLGQPSSSGGRPSSKPVIRTVVCSRTVGARSRRRPRRAGPRPAPAPARTLIELYSRTDRMGRVQQRPKPAAAPTSRPAPARTPDCREAAYPRSRSTLHDQTLLTGTSRTTPPPGLARASFRAPQRQSRGPGQTELNPEHQPAGAKAAVPALLPPPALHNSCWPPHRPP